jgi:hypothetical protein
VAGSCEYGHEPSGSGTMELVSLAFVKFRAFWDVAAYSHVEVEW